MEKWYRGKICAYMDYVELMDDEGNITVFRYDWRTKPVLVYTMLNTVPSRYFYAMKMLSNAVDEARYILEKDEQWKKLPAPARVHMVVNLACRIFKEQYNRDDRWEVKVMERSRGGDAKILLRRPETLAPLFRQQVV